MSVHHRPSRKAQRPSRKPATTAQQVPLEATSVARSDLPVASVGETAAPVALPPAAIHCAPASATAANASANAGDQLAANVEQHFVRLSELIAKAERIAGQLLDALQTRIQRREQVYPGELAHICRGLQVLAKCSTELARASRRGDAGQVSSAQVAQLEARLKTAFGL